MSFTDFIVFYIKAIIEIVALFLVQDPPCLWYVGVSQHQQLATLKPTVLLFLCTVILLMGISCCAMLILCRNNIGNCSFISILLTVVLFHFFFLCVCHSDSPVSFLGASIVCVNNLKRTADLIL